MSDEPIPFRDKRISQEPPSDLLDAIIANPSGGSFTPPPSHTFTDEQLAAHNETIVERVIAIFVSTWERSGIVQDAIDAARKKGVGDSE